MNAQNKQDESDKNKKDRYDPQYPIRSSPAMLPLVGIANVLQFESYSFLENSGPGQLSPIGIFPLYQEKLNICFYGIALQNITLANISIYLLLQRSVTILTLTALLECSVTL